MPRRFCFAALPLAFIAVTSGSYIGAALCAAPPPAKLIVPSPFYPSPPVENSIFSYVPHLPPLLPKPAHLPPITASKSQHYCLVALPEDFSASALNDKGEIAGTWFKGEARPTSGEPATYARASVWKNNRIIYYPNREEQPDCAAEAISENSKVGCVGGATYSDPVHGRYSAFVWRFTFPQKSAATPDAIKKTQTAGHLPGISGVEVRGINRRGQMVGWCYAWDIAEEIFHGDFKDAAGDGLGDVSGFYWDGQRLVGLGPGAAAYGINERNQVVGVQEGNITLWQYDERRFLGKGRAYSINNRGWIAGEKDVSGKNVPFYDTAPLRHAFVWRGNGALEDLKCLPGDTISKARWINDKGQIVGLSLGVTREGKTRKRAVLWQVGKIMDLNAFVPRDFGWILSDARAINNKGQIIVRGSKGDDERSFLLTPR